MKYFCQLLLSIFFIFLAACGPSTLEPTMEPEEATVEPQSLPLQDQSEEGLRVALTPTSESNSDVEAAPVAPAEEAYPIPIPTPILMEGDYPEPPQPPQPPSGYDAYPEADSSVWVLFPVGEQCADESRYEDMVTAVADLTAAGITVYESEIVELIVCSACGCPTSAHFRVSIDASQLSTAQAMEWTAEE